MRKLFFLLVLLLANLYSNSQDFSNRGKDFWLAYPTHIDGTLSVMGLYITSDQNASGTINVGGTTIPFTVTANTITRKFLGPNAAGDAPNTGVHLTAQDGIETGKGIRVVSDRPVVVYAHIIRSARSGATLVLPVSVLSREYIVPSYRNTGSGGATGGIGELAIVATDTNTVVEITPSVISRNGARAAGVPYNITLANPGDVYQVQFQQNADISGTTVRSVSLNGIKCKKIAVFSATTWSAFDCTSPVASGGDNLFQQPFPTTSWGKNFLTAPFFNNPSNRDIIRVFVKDPTTVVTKTEAGVTTTLTGLINNSYYEYTTGNPTAITASGPSSVVMYIRSQTCQSPAIVTDPEMIVINPVEQTINNITVFSAHQNFVPVGQSQVVNHYLNIIIKTNSTASFRINGVAPAGTFTAIPGTLYSYLREDVSARSASNPVHSLSADSAFIAIAYGFGSFESYGYNAGTNVRDLFQFIGTQNALGVVSFPAACINSPFNFAITFPYQPDSIRWNFNGLFAPVAYSAPVPDSTYIIAGRTVYRYKIPATYTVATAGSYPVKVYARNPIGDGCTSDQEIDFDLQVFNPPTTDFTWPAALCTDSIIPFTTNNTTGGRPIIKHFWDFGDGTYAYTNNPNKVYTSPGRYKIRYAVLTDVGCLSDTIEKFIDITKTPVAKFGFTLPQCQGKLITFGDTSSLAGGFGTIVNWNWNLGVGAPVNNATNAGVSATYPSSIIYNPTLQVKTNTGCLSPVYSVPLSVHPNPVPDFTMTYACLPDGVVNFNSTSTIADGSQASFAYRWYFGDPPAGILDTAFIQNPSHKYSSTGTYNIKLKITSNNGCIDSVTKSQSAIYPQPKADFTAPAEVCDRTVVSFADASNGITHPLVKWEWRFMNAAGTVVGSSTSKDTVFKFPSAGTYKVRHWAFTNQGCVSDTAEKQVIIHPLPTALYTLSTPLCEKNQVIITDNSTANAGSLVRWYWNLGDGTIINATTNPPITHTYASWGNKATKLMVESSKGCLSDTLFKTVLINPLPKPGYVLPEVCLSDANAFFFDTSRIADNSELLMTYLWKFNTGTPAIVPGPAPISSTSKNPAIKFNKADYYFLSLTVTSKDGCKDSVTNIPFTVNGSIPNADFLLLPTNGICSNQDVQIQEKSSVDFGALTKVEIYWDNLNAPTVFDTDDNPVTNKIYSHRYPNFQSPLTRTFQIRYRAYTGIICVNDEIKTIVVNASPLTQFLAMPGICFDATPRQITEATELGGLPGNGIYSGPGVSSTGLFNPANAGVGIHTIRYTFIASNGCTHYTEQTIEVWPRPVSKFGYLLPACEKNSMTFIDSSVANAASLTAWNWNFGDASPIVSASNANPLKHIFNSYGTYNVVLQVINNRGCTSVPTTVPVKVNPLPVVDFSLPKVCLPDGSAAFNDLSVIPDNTQSQFTYKWDFGVRSLSSDTAVVKNPVYKYSNLGPYTVQLKVTSGNNCIDSLSKVLVDVFPQPKAAFTSKDSLCIGDLIDFTDQSDGIVRPVTQWRWLFGNGAGSSVQNPGYLYPSPGTYNVQLYVYSSEGCVSDTAVKTIDVWAYPAINAGPDIEVLEDGVRKITGLTATGSGLQFLWTPPTYLDNPTLQHPTIIKPKDDITYTITVTGRGGCVSTDDLFVKILKMPKPPNTFTPNGDGINDFWEIRFLNDYPGCVIEVYNTAGTLVYRSVGYSTPWDGKWKGQQLPAGTYYYVIDPKNGRARQAGYVTLLR